jgi:dUTP pyrophosphatase
VITKKTFEQRDGSNIIGLTLDDRTTSLNFEITKILPESFFEKIKKCFDILFRKELKEKHTFSFNTSNEIKNFLNNIKEYYDFYYKYENIENFIIEKTRKDAILPMKKIKSDVCYDVSTPETLVLNPFEMKLVDFGFKIKLKPGYEIQMRNRSGMVSKYKVFMALGVGTIDPDYRGNIKAPFINLGRETIAFERGSRVAQFTMKKIDYFNFKEGKVDGKTERGTGGFGHTGL